MWRHYAPFCAPAWIIHDDGHNACPQCTGDDDECAALCLPCHCGSICECILCGCGVNLERSGNETCLPCFAVRCRTRGQPLRSGFGHLCGESSFAGAWDAAAAAEGGQDPPAHIMYCWPPLCCAQHPGVTCCTICDFCDDKCDRRGDRDGAGLTAAQRHQMARAHVARDGRRPIPGGLLVEEYTAQVMDRRTASTESDSSLTSDIENSNGNDNSHSNSNSNSNDGGSVYARLRN